MSAGDTRLAGGLSRYATMIKGQGPSLLTGGIVGPQRPPPYHCPPSPDHPTLKMSPNRFDLHTLHGHDSIPTD
eukprot:191508-Hanusia_phi.AAC.1